MRPIFFLGGDGMTNGEAIIGILIVLGALSMALLRMAVRDELEDIKGRCRRMEDRLDRWAEKPTRLEGDEWKDGVDADDLDYEEN